MSVFINAIISAFAGSSNPAEALMVSVMQVGQKVFRNFRRPLFSTCKLDRLSLPPHFEQLKSTGTLISFYAPHARFRWFRWGFGFAVGVQGTLPPA